MVELCAFKQRLNIIYYLLSMYDNEGKLTIWCRLVKMAQRSSDIDATVAFRTLKLMTEPPPPPIPEPTDDFDEGQGLGLAEEVAAQVPTVNATWKRVHACDFEKAIKLQLASSICDDAKVIDSLWI